MKCTKMILLVLIFTLNWSCTKENNEFNEDESMVFDFSYSMSYASDSSFVQVCYTDACSNIPDNCNISWTATGFDLYSQNNEAKCRLYYHNGQFSIVMKVVTPDNIQHSVTKEFEIKGIK